MIEMYEVSKKAARLKNTYYRMRRNQFVYIICQASSGREMDQNKGLRLLL